jgi:outer membrane protein assembly factor BamB
VSRWRRVKVSLLVALPVLLAFAVGELFASPEVGGDLNSADCGSIVHSRSGSARCVSDRLGYYAVMMVAALVTALVVAGLVYLVLTIAAWVRRGSPGRSRRRRVGLVSVCVVVPVIAATGGIASASRHAPDPCRPAATASAAATGDRVDQHYGDEGATGRATLTPPVGATYDWCVHTSDDFAGDLPVTNKGTMYLEGADVNTIAVSLSDGRVRWRSSALGSPKAFVDGLVVVNGYDDVYGVDASTGRVRWKTPSGPTGNHTQPGGLVVSGNRVYVTTRRLEDASWVRALDVRTGAVLATRQLPALIPYAGPGLVAAGGTIVVPIAQSSVPVSAGGLVALDAASLRVRWRAAVSGTFDRMLAYDGRVALSLSAGRSVSVFALADGHELWSRPSGTNCVATSLLADGTRLVDVVGGPASCAGTVALDPAGRTIWKGAYLGTAWLSGGRLVGVDWLGRVDSFTVVSLDAANGSDYRRLAVVRGRLLDPFVVGGRVLMTRVGWDDAVVAYGHP